MPGGYSGHERGYHVPVGRCCARCEDYREAFHDRKTLEGNDHTVSLLPEEFAAMVRQIRDIEESIGTAAPREVSTGELMNRVNLAKSLVATRGIAKGEVITEADVTVKSPGRGLQPNYLPQLLGRTIQRDVEEGSFFLRAT